MYRLYVNNGVWEKLTNSNLEKDIVDCLEYEYRHKKGGRYAIIRDIGNGDEVYKVIENEQEYKDYMQFYRHKMIKELSVIELKQQILDIKEGKNVK